MLGEFHFSQPVFDLQDVELRLEDGEFLIACQGRHVECLKSRQILSRAHDFLAQVKNRFLDRGPEFARELDGDFIFTIYHKEKHQLTIINNRTQAHKLYYSILEDQLIFSERFDALLKRLPDREVHRGSVRAFVSNGFTMADQTQIKGIKKFLPAFVLTATAAQVTLNSYWQHDFHFAKKPFNNLDLAITEYETLYQNGVRAFTESYETKELGTLLSGGHDTSFCLIESTQAFKRPLHAFTCTFPNWIILAPEGISSIASQERVDVILGLLSKYIER